MDAQACALRALHPALPVSLHHGGGVHVAAAGAVDNVHDFGLAICSTTGQGETAGFVGAWGVWDPLLQRLRPGAEAAPACGGLQAVRAGVHARVKDGHYDPPAIKAGVFLQQQGREGLGVTRAGRRVHGRARAAAPAPLQSLACRKAAA